jgi:hypothetical protein
MARELQSWIARHVWNKQLLQKLQLSYGPLPRTYRMRCSLALFEAKTTSSQQMQPE